MPKKQKILRAIHASVAIEKAYNTKLYKLIRSMQKSVDFWVQASYKRNTPEIRLLAEDSSPAVAMRNAVRRLSRRWQKNFDIAAPQLAKYFALSASQRSDVALKRILREGGFSVPFKMTRAMNDVMQATVAENVSLIKSIPSQYFTQIEGAVMRSVQAGRDVGQLAEELQKQYGVSLRRASLIARDQGRKINANIQRVRYAEIGLDDAIWMHSGGGKEPRPTHLKAGADRVRFKLSEGWFDPAVQKNIWPGTEINCRCQFRPIVEGFS